MFHLLDANANLRAAVLPTREYTMMEVMNRLTDKPGWETKVFNSVIVEKWKAEVLAMPEQDISEKMFDYVCYT